jgi:hypothetical protein
VSTVPSAVAIFVLVLLAALPIRLAAHDIPNDVTIQTLVKPEGSRVRVLARVPLAAMRDIDYPKRGASNSGLLDLARADRTLADAATLWIGDFLSVYENGAKLPSPTVAAVRAALPSDPSFATYEQALAHVTGPKLPDDTEFIWTQGLLDVLFEYPIQSAGSRFSIDPRFARLGIRTLTVVRFVTPDGQVRAFELQGDPGLVHLDPTWRQTASRFGALGFDHLLGGTEYLLLLVCLIVPFRRIREVVLIAVAFTLAHIVTLVASTYGLAPDALWFPPLVDALVAIAIVALALENIVGATAERRPAVAFACGLVQGFAFAFALRRTLQFAGAHTTMALASFVGGLELGQLVVLAIAVPAITLVFSSLVSSRVGTIVLSAAIAHTAWHWTLDRWSLLRQFRFEWPVFDLAFWAAAMRWGMVAVVLAGLYWLIATWRLTFLPRSTPP